MLFSLLRALRFRFARGTSFFTVFCCDIVASLRPIDLDLTNVKRSSGKRDVDSNQYSCRLKLDRIRSLVGSKMQSQAATSIAFS